MKRDSEPIDHEYEAACGRNHAWMRRRLALVLGEPLETDDPTEQPEEPATKKPRKVGCIRETKPIGLTIDQIRELVLRGKASPEIAKLAGCKVGIIQKLRVNIGIARPCPDCLQPTGRGLTATYCIGCAAKHDKHGRTRQACGHAGCTHLHHARGYCRAHQAEAPKPPRAQEAPCD